MNYLNPKVYAAEAPNGKGRGLFAKAKIEKDEIIEINRDIQILTKAEIALLPASWSDHCYEIDDSREACPKDINNLPLSFFMNHSCDPNVGSKADIQTSVAMQDIQPGEEITYDYAMTDGGNYEMKCLCGAKNCRGIIRGGDWQNPELQKRYRGYFQGNIQTKINAENRV